jgi:hypothetical protein
VPTGRHRGNGGIDWSPLYERNQLVEFTFHSLLVVAQLVQDAALFWREGVLHPVRRPASPAIGRRRKTFTAEFSQHYNGHGIDHDEITQHGTVDAKRSARQPHDTMLSS